MTSTRSPSRRTILRAVGASVALPTMVSLLPRTARAQAPIKRFAALFFPNGSTYQHQDWLLGGNEKDYTMGTAHVSLAPFKSAISMFQNLHGRSAGSPDHSRGTAEFLTASAITNQATPEVAISIDQAIANELKPPTRIRSLHLGPTPYPGGNPADTGWPSGYNVSISWSSSTTPNAPLENAQVAFNQVFAPGGSAVGDAVAAKRLRLRQSVLDHVIDQIKTISPRLGKDDGVRLDQYLTSIREVESRLQRATPTAQSPACKTAVAPAGALSFPEHTRAMLDIVTLALACDVTRIVTYSMDYGFGSKDFGFLGLGNARHHNLSHSGTDAKTINVHLAIVRWYMEQFAYFLGRMQGVDEGGVTLLDNSLVYLGSDVGDGWSHAHVNLPAILAGGAAGAINPGRLIGVKGRPYASVLLAMAHAMDARLPSFAGQTVPFPEL